MKFKSLFKILKWMQRRFRGINENTLCLSEKELELLLKYADKKKGGNFLEIGSAFGQTTKKLADKGLVVAIDPLIPDKKGLIMGTFAEDIMLKFMKNILGKNVCYFPLKSEDLIKGWKDCIKFDLIFIDGLHTYEQVKKDYEWLKYLNEGGYIIFHDTNMEQIREFIDLVPMKELEYIDKVDSLKVFRRGWI